MKKVKFSSKLILTAVSVLTILFILTCSCAYATNLYNENNQQIYSTTKTVDRLSGTNRYGTMLDVVNETLDKFPDTKNKPCILARGDDFPDALASNFFAGLFDGAIVLTNAKALHLNNEAADALSILKPSKIWVPGASIPDNILGEAIAINPGCTYDVVAGTNRCYTAFELYKRARQLGFSLPNVAVVSNGWSYADPASAAPLLYQKHYPIFLTNRDGDLFQDIIEEIGNAGFTKVIILGSEAAVSNYTQKSIENKLGPNTTIRLGGKNRIATSTIVADYCVNSESMTYDNMAIAWGYSNADPLSIGPLCGKNNSISMLTDTNSMYYSVLSQISNNYQSINNVYVAGGPPSVSDRIKNKVYDILNTDALSAYICFCAETSTNSKITIHNNSSNTIHLEYKYLDSIKASFTDPAQNDNDGWYSFDLAPNSQNDFIEFYLDQKLYLRGTGNSSLGSDNLASSFNFDLNGSFSCIGKLNSLLDYSTVEAGGQPTISSYCFANLFASANKNSSLITAPSLDATVISNSCYKALFKNCSGLTICPSLPATAAKPSCYESMLENCEELTLPPTIACESLQESCYKNMFYACSNLTVAPNLPVESLSVSCYDSMFAKCSKLTQAPNLPGQTLSNCCYKSMFYKCDSLAYAPNLPATNLAVSCYESMFESCIKLKDAPHLESTTLTSKCYNHMFDSCSNLAYIKIKFTTWENDTTQDWLKNTKSVGLFYGPSSLDTSTRDSSHIPVNWVPTSAANNYLSFTAMDSSGAKIKITNTALHKKNIEICYLDPEFESNWQDFSLAAHASSSSSAPSVESLNINQGDTVFFRGINSSL
ncbi:MAG: cell wall-binding repeat-containing protein, partial [Coriobacteriales bacterium]|nr:cell wall-binding repeat-containing protein [Coriobacteriales bacterium]